MSKLDSLLQRVSDPSLRAELSEAVAEIRSTKDFGLVFESHLPETVKLPHHPIRRGVKVSRRDGDDRSIWEVVKVAEGVATLASPRASDDHDGPEPASEIEEAVDALVVVAEFGDTIYPGLKKVGEVKRGGDKPSHIVINAENHHALEALQFTHAGKVDCIYIDPPYNTGARDWKYNNNYVDGDDAYRHSKWLAFIQRRLLLSKRLLDPEESVLIVTIDEKEVLRLGLLLEQLFPGAKVQLVSIVINAPGQARKQELARVNEFAFFLFLGAAEPFPTSDDLLNDEPSNNPRSVRWESLLRSGTNSRREDRPALFYPVFVDPERQAIHGVGESRSLESKRSDWRTPRGMVAIWPLKSDDSEGNWRASPEYLLKLVAKGYARVGRFDRDSGRGVVWYLGRSAQRKIDSGEIVVTGSDEQGAVTVAPADGAQRNTIVKTVWNRASHHAGWHGSALLRSLLPTADFPFPKSLYSVEDALRVAVGSKVDAVVLDFFVGSGTTTHAVARLNRQDGGQRRSITVTNNEVSDDEAKRLRKEGNRPGDPEWEALGIFEHVTRPRIVAAITGLTPQGEPVKGDYKFTDEFPMSEGFDENAEFFELTYQDPSRIELDRAFNAIAPLLWMRAGGQGEIVEESLDSAGRRKPYAWTDRYGVLFNPDRWQSFVSRLPDMAKTVFIVTDSPTVFANVVAELPSQVIESVRLYERYLTTFAINGRPEGSV